MAIELPKLPFSPDALEPHISKRTLEFHYGKHHKNYVDTLNKLIKDTHLDSFELEEIMHATFGKKQKIFNNAAQAWNHSFMWNCLTGEALSPTKSLDLALSETFGSMVDFKHEFTEKAKDLFGSGWAWLVKDKDGLLQIRALSNAENPLLYDEIPLFTCDVWEHAYYLDYQNERLKYLDNYWSVINWAFLEENLEQVVNPEPLREHKKSPTEGKSPSQFQR